jgi:hypothetical protein
MIGAKALIVVAAWVLMAAAWTPPTVTLQISTGAPRAHLHFAILSSGSRSGAAAGSSQAQ